MSANSVVGLPERRNAFLPIAVGGLSAGILDLTQALTLFGTRVSLGIAAGLLGRQAVHGGGIAIYVWASYSISLSLSPRPLLTTSRAVVWSF